MERMLKSRTRTQGGSLTTTIPVEVGRRLGLSEGDELYWVSDGAGGYHVSVSRPDIRKVLEAHEEVLEEYRDVFKALAE